MISPLITKRTFTYSYPLPYPSPASGRGECYFPSPDGARGFISCLPRKGGEGTFILVARDPQPYSPLPLAGEG